LTSACNSKPLSPSAFASTKIIGMPDRSGSPRRRRSRSACDRRWCHTPGSVPFRSCGDRTLLVLILDSWSHRKVIERTPYEIGEDLVLEPFRRLVCGVAIRATRVKIVRLVGREIPIEEIPIAGRSRFVKRSASPARVGNDWL
jgi:hypothetical protein